MDGERRVSFKELDLATAIQRLEQLRRHTSEADVEMLMDFLSALSATAGLYEAAHRPAEAVPLYEEAVAKRMNLYGPTHRLVLTTMNNHALCLASVKRYEEAEQQLKACLSAAAGAAANANASDEEVNFVATVEGNLGALCRTVGRLDDAVTFYEASMERHRARCASKGDGALDADAVIATGLLADMYDVAERYSAAAKLNQRVVEVGTPLLGAGHTAVVLAFRNLAFEKQMMGEHAESEAVYRRCLAAQRAAAGVTDGGNDKEDEGDGSLPDDALTTMEELGVLLARQGRLPEAIALFRRVHRRRTVTLGDDAPATLQTLSYLGVTLTNAGDVDAATDALAQCLAGRRRRCGDDDVATLRAMVNLASAHESADRPAEAAPLYREAAAGLARALGDGHEQTLFATQCLAHCYEKLSGAETEGAAAAAAAAAAETRAQAKDLYTAVLTRRQREGAGDSPAVLRLLHRLATVLGDNGEDAASAACFHECAERRRRALGEADPSYLSSLCGLAHACTRLGQHARALALQEECLKAYTALHGPAHHVTVSTACNVAACLRRAGGPASTLERAADIYREALQRRTEQLTRTHPLTLAAMFQLAATLDKLGQYSEAEPLFSEAYRGHRDRLPGGAAHPRTREAMVSLAGCVARQQRYAEAQPLLEEALAAQRAARAAAAGSRGPVANGSGGGAEVAEGGEQAPAAEAPSADGAAAAAADHENRSGDADGPPPAPTSVPVPAPAPAPAPAADGVSVIDLSTPDAASGEPHTSAPTADAAAHVESTAAAEAAAAVEAGVGPEAATEAGGSATAAAAAAAAALEVETLQTMHNLAACHSHLGQLDPAAALYSECLAARLRLLGPTHTDTLLTAGNLAVVRDKRKEPKEALDMYALVLEGRRATLPADDPRVLDGMQLVAIRAGALGAYPRARPLFEALAAVRRAAHGEDHAVTLAAVNSLATCYVGLKMYAEALPLYTDTLARRRALQGERTLADLAAAEPEAAAALLTSVANLALCQSGLGQAENAETLYEEALEGRRQVLGEDHPATLVSLQNMAIHWRSQGEADLAEECYVELLEKKRAVHGAEHESTLATMAALVSLYQKVKKPRLAVKAEAIYVQYYDLLVKRHGEKDKAVLESKQWLEQVQFHI